MTSAPTVPAAIATVSGPITTAAGPITTVMAREHQAIVGLVETASRALLVPEAAEGALRDAAAAVAYLHRHIAVEERVLFGRPLLLEAAYAEHHLVRDHSLILTLLGAIATPTGASFAPDVAGHRPLRVLAALRRLHHLLEHHDQREVDGICRAVDAALPVDDAATIAEALATGFAARGDSTEVLPASRDDVHAAPELISSAAPGPFCEALWRHAARGEPLDLPPIRLALPARRRAIEVACAALDVLLDEGQGAVTLKSVDQALRIDRLLLRRDPG